MPRTTSNLDPVLTHFWHPVVPDFQVERDGWGFRYGYAHLARNPEEVGALHGTDAAEQVREMDFLFFPPFGIVARRMTVEYRRVMAEILDAGR